MIVYLVYLITNRVNGKRYTGQTKHTLEDRFKKHKEDALVAKRGYALHAAIRKYGIKNFEIKLVARCNSLEESNHREAYYIKLFNTLAPNGYNLKPGGDNSSPTEETRKKQSDARKGEKHHFFGKHFSEEHKKNLSIANKGRKHGPAPEERKRKQSEAHKGKKITEKHRENLAKAFNKAINVPELDITFKSFEEACKALKTQTKNIRSVLSGKRKHWKGITFKLAKSEDVSPISKKSAALLEEFLNNKASFRPIHFGRKRNDEHMKGARASRAQPIKVLEWDRIFLTIDALAEECDVSGSLIVGILKGKCKNTLGITMIKLPRTDFAYSSPVLCLENQIEYDSIAAAAKDLGLEKGKIKEIAQGKRKSAKGYTFKYVLEGVKI